MTTRKAEAGTGTRPGAASKAPGPDFASASLPRHLARGVIGFGGLVGSVALIPAVGPVSLLLLPVGALALRGCPMCWTIGWCRPSRAAGCGAPARTVTAG